MKKLLKEFGDFIKKGNVLDLAVAVVIGGAFTAIVNSLVECIINPLIGMICGGIDLSSSLVVTVGDARFYFGALIEAIIKFLIIAIAVFLLVKLINKLMNLKKKKEEEKPAPAAKSDEVVLLEQIRDLLKKNK
jgi:large conductance mechanosensitive channel